MTKGAALRAAWELYAECQKAHARKRSSRAPPWRTELSWASAPLMFGTMVARPSGPSAAMAVCVQPDHEVPKEPTVPFAHSWPRIHAMVSAPSSASGIEEVHVALGAEAAAAVLVDDHVAARGEPAAFAERGLGLRLVVGRAVQEDGPRLGERAPVAGGR